MNIFITGVAGFIGFHLAKKLLESDHNIIGIDNLNDYYDPALKKNRLDILNANPKFTFHQIDLLNAELLNELFQNNQIDRIIHLAAQAGIRYSIENPHAYIDANIKGFLNILEICRHYNIPHLIYASSSSVYGNNTKIPFSINDRVDQQVSLYGVTKRSNELMAESYHHLCNLPVTGLRLFTVYGPWGRPDMSYYKFTRSIIKRQPIDVYNNGEHERDFTYITDVIDGICKVLNQPIENKCRLYNLGNNKPVKLLDYIKTFESLLGIKAELNYLPMQKGDMQVTYADIDESVNDFGYAPHTLIEEGLGKFIDWYKEYHQIEL